MNVSFTAQQRNTLIQGAAIFVVAVGFVAAAQAAHAMPSHFAIQSAALLAFAQGVVGA